MYQKIKVTLLTLISIILWIRFFLMLWDPYWGNADLTQGLAVYRDLRAPLDQMYIISGYIMAPVYYFYRLLAPWIPKLSWFPGFQTVAILRHLSNMAVNSPVMSAQISGILQSAPVRQTMVGYVDLLISVAQVFYQVIGPLVDYLVEYLKNVIWNIMIEFSFTKKREDTYQEALGKRAADLMKLNVEYKNLSKEANMLAKSVVTDELTQVYNKRFFIEKITYEFKLAKERRNSLAVVMVDIDHFKRFNDTYGHLLGDKVLKAVAQVAKGFTPKDSYCCRFGGEEFALILPGKDVETVLDVVSHIHLSLPLLRFDDDPTMSTSASFGVCLVDFNAPQTQDITNFESLVKLADDELYKAKLNGRNRIELCQIV